MTHTYYITIGNSNNKLNQERWSRFQFDVKAYLINEELESVVRIQGVWYSLPTAVYQNMCICFEINTSSSTLAEIHVPSDIKGFLRGLAEEYGQDSIAWAEAEVTFLRP